jgi:hypothetical protein
VGTHTCIMVFWIVTPCSLVGGYQCFKRICCFYLQGHFDPEEGDMGTLISSRMLKYLSLFRFLFAEICGACVFCQLVICLILDCF